MWRIKPGGSVLGNIWWVLAFELTSLVSGTVWQVDPQGPRAQGNQCLGYHINHVENKVINLSTLYSLTDMQIGYLKSTLFHGMWLEISAVHRQVNSLNITTILR